jgi:tetratricopeptide (TPR) repeat protein
MDFAAAFSKMGNAKAEAECQKGHVFIGQSKYKEASECFRQCVKIEPSNKVYLLALAQALESAGGNAHGGSLEEAESTYRKVLELHPNFAGAMAGLQRLGVSVEITEKVAFEALPPGTQAEILDMQAKGVGEGTILSLYGCKPPSPFTVGCLVELHSMKSAVYNGRFGPIVSEAGDNGRYGVLLDGQSKPVAIRPTNMRHAADTAMRQ